MERDKRSGALEEQWRLECISSAQVESEGSSEMSRHTTH